DDEVLALALLEVEDAVVAAHSQPAQLDAVRGRAGHVCAPVLAGLGAWSATAETTRQAIAEVAGSWTRTAQAPACGGGAGIGAAATRRWSGPAKWWRAARCCRWCSAFPESTSPGSTTMGAGAPPTAPASSMRVRSAATTRATTSS